MKKIICSMLSCIIIIHVSAMQRFMHFTKRSMATITHQKKCTQTINKVARLVAKKGEFPANCKLNGTYVSNQFICDILNAIRREQGNNTCMPQLEKGIEDIFCLVHQIKNESNNLQFKMAHKKIKSFSERFEQNKEQ